MRRALQPSDRSADRPALRGRGVSSIREMPSRRPARSAALLSVALACAWACGTEDPTPPGGGDSIFPIAKGNRWEFRIQDSSGDVSAKIQTINSPAPDGALMFKTERGDRETFSVQKIDEEVRLVRLSE